MNIGSIMGAGDLLGKAVVEISADMDKYKKGVDEAHNKLKTFDANAAKITRNIGIGMTAAGTAIVASLLASVNAAVKFGDEVDKASRRTGVAAETFSAFSYAAQISGTSTEQMEGSLRRLAANMDEAVDGTGEAAEWFKKLNISVTDVHGTMLPVTDVFMRAADAIAGLDSKTEQVIATQEVFGARFGTQILPMLLQGSEGVKKLTDRAEELGLVISTDAAIAAANFQDAMTDLKGVLGAVTRSIGAALIPVLLPLVKEMTNILIKIREWIDLHPKLTETIGKFGLILGGVAAVGGPLILFSQGIGKIATIIPGAITQLSLLSGSLAGLPALITPVVGVLGVAGLAGAIFLITEEIKRHRSEMEKLAAQRTGKQYFTEQAEAVEAATTQMRDTIRATEDFMTTQQKLGDSTERTNRMLEQMKGKTVMLTTEGLDEATKALIGEGKLVSAMDLLNKAMAETPRQFSAWEQMTQQFKQWSDITGAGYQANLLVIRDYWRGRLAEAEKGSKEELAIQRSIADVEAKLADERYGAWMLPARKVATERPLLLEQTKDRELKIVQVGEDGKRELIGWSLSAILQLGREFSEKWLKRVQEQNQKELEFTQNMIVLRERLAARMYDYDIYTANLAHDTRNKERADMQKQQEWRENYVIQGAEKIIAEKEREFRSIKHLYENEKEYNLARKIAYMAIYDDMIEKARQSGMDITALEEYKNEQLAALTEAGTAAIAQGLSRRAALYERHWTDYVDTIATGINASANLWADLWSIWHNTEMEWDKFHQSSIGKLTVWVDRVNSLVKNAIATWNSFNTIIAVTGKLLGVGGGGGGGGGSMNIPWEPFVASQSAGGGGGSFLGKIGGGIKTGVTTVAGLPWGTIASTAAAWTPTAVAALFYLKWGEFVGKGLWNMFTDGGGGKGTVTVTRTQEDWIRIWEAQQRDAEIRYQQAQQFAEGQRIREERQLELASYSLEELKRIYEIFPELRDYMHKTWQSVEERGIAGGRYGQVMGGGAVTIQAGVVVADEYSMQSLAERLKPYL